MAPKLLAFVVFIWVVGSILGGVIEQASLGTDEAGVLKNLTSWTEMRTEETFGPFAMVTFATNFFGSLWNMLTFDFAFLTGPWVYVRWIVFAPIIAMVVYGAISVVLSIFSRVLP